jgi:outer membrane protein
MKKFTHTLLALGAFCATSLISRADNTPKIVVVDMNKLYETHYETVAEQAKVKADTEKAQASFDTMTKERDDLIAQYKAIVDQAQNPTATPEAKAKSQADAQKKGQEAQQKVQDMQTFANQARATIQQRIQNFHTMMVEEISKTVVQVAATHNATLVLDKTGLSVTGVPSVIYADSSYDITAEVQAEIAQHKPAAVPAVAPDATPMPMPAPAAADSSPPAITVPGSK